MAPIRARFEARQLEAEDLKAGRVDPYYGKVLSRLLAAHALAESLTAAGYARALATLPAGELRAEAEKNLAEEERHAQLVYRLLAELGLSPAASERQLIGWRKSASFDAPRYFAQQASGELDLLMGSISLDATGLIIIGVNYRDSSYAPHARAADLIMEEEAEHDEFSARGLRDAVLRHGRERVTEALRLWLPKAANFFGPPGSGFSDECLRLGLKRQDNGDLRDLFLALMERRLAQSGLAMPPLGATYPFGAV